MNDYIKPGMMWVDFISTTASKGWEGGVIYLTGIVLILSLSEYTYLGWSDKPLTPFVFNGILTDCFYNHFWGAPKKMIFTGHNAYNQALIDDKEVNNYAAELGMEIEVDPFREVKIEKKIKIVSRYAEYFSNHIISWNSGYGNSLSWSGLVRE